METTPTHLHTHGAIRTTRRPVSRKAAVLMAVAAVTPVAITPLYADHSGIAAKEIARRAGLVAEADKELHAGRAAYKDKNYKKAHEHYTKAISLLPPGPALADRRHSYTGHLGDAAVALAQEYRRVGKYAEARTLLEGVLLRDPTNFRAKKQLEYLDDPIRTNPANSFAHTQNVNKVRKLLYMGEGYYNLGKYDEAEAEFKKVLLIDPYNRAARRWMERVNVTKSDYYRAAYDHARSQMLMEVDRAWEIAVPREVRVPAGQGAGGGPSSGVQYIQQKLNTINIPLVSFDNTTLEEALDYLRLRARELDPEPDPAKKGINFIIRKPSVTAEDGGDADADADALADPVGGAAAGGLASLRIDELKLRNVPLGTVLQYICDKTRLRYKLDEHSVILLPLTAVDQDDLYTRKFVVPPDFLASLDDGDGGGEVDDDPFGGGGDEPAGLTKRASAQELLQRNGVSFPDKAFAKYIAATSTLVVRNTLSNLDVIEDIIEAIRGRGPRQVRIMTKFVEVSQENTDELGFDWIINPVGLNGSSTFVSGGTIGNGSPRVGADFQRTVGFDNIGGIPAGANQSVSRIATAGLRSGDFATTRNSIDALLNNPNRTAQSGSVAPGILTLTGLFTDGEVQMIMRGLAQKKGTDIMTAPSVLARSGEKATIEVIREFIYPTEYEPPELPNSVGVGGGIGGGVGGVQGGSTFPVTPATPTAFETRNTGVTLEIEPTIGESNYTIDLRFAPEIVEFEGFINYGSPIQSPASDALGNPIQITITENRIEMPVFSTRRVNTALTIYDGYTVAVGGLMREDVQKVEDKVPVLGDLPLIGRLFKSEAENRIKSNLIIFVTAQIIDAAGNPINSPTDAAAPGAPGAVSAPVGAGGLGDDPLPTRG